MMKDSIFITPGLGKTIFVRVTNTSSVDDGGLIDSTLRQLLADKGYEIAARMLGRPVVEVLLSRMADKLARACNLVRNGQAAVKDESLADTLLDLANYAVLAVVALGKDNQED